MRITLAAAPKADLALEWHLDLPEGSTLEQALVAAPWRSVFDPNQPAPVASIWGRRAEPSSLLRDGDRVELTRELLVTPKDARRRRFTQQRRDGLFVGKK